jgi:hypothetical protein
VVEIERWNRNDYMVIGNDGYPYHKSCNNSLYILEVLE